ncbi:MAG: hypothetical protein WC907_08370 [Acholeplasmataceae bacterium]
MIIFNTNKVEFTEDKLIINKKNKIEIKYNDIEKCWYSYPSLKSRLYIMISRTGGIIPGWLQIRDSCQKLHLIKLKSEEIEKLPRALKTKIKFNKRDMYE